MTGMVGEWMLTRVDGEKTIGYRWIEGGAGPDPDWTWFDEDDYPEPIEVLAERFIDAPYTAPDDGLFCREERRRWFGLTEHEFECIEPEGSCVPEDWECVNCGVPRPDVEWFDAPWDEHCRPIEEEE